MGLNFLTFVEILLVVVLFTDFTYSSKWSYKGNTGPKHWKDLFPEACSGKLQSPININPEETTYNPNLRAFAIWYDPPRENAKMFVKNNGHAVQVDCTGDFFVTNGGLPNVYKTSQFHFHWGHANHHGSEHHIQGQPHPLELHIVNYNDDLFGTIGEAATEPLGLAVLGVLFEITDEDNEALKPVLKAMEKVRDPDEKNLVEIKAVSLRDLLPADISRYFRYNGSLTTPGCFESVVWTVFEERQKISIDQLLEFRKVLKPKHHKHKHHGKRHIRRSTAEKNAESVIDELGIRGNHMEEDELKADLERKQADGASHAETTTPSADAAELDEHSAKRAEENIVRHINEKKAEDEKSHDEHMKHMSEKEGNEGLKEYIQEILVNNFRPIQPVNNRLIQRSFKLSPPKTMAVDCSDPKYHIHDKPQGKAGPLTDESGSGQLRVSVVFFITTVLSLLYIVS